MNLNNINSSNNNNNNNTSASGNNNNKAQKGWLSRWTRKQWSRHWFVLKNGSLTYYRGPAAELCSFLDGVLDLSLIKHIEVQQQEELAAGNHHAQQQQHYGQQNNHYHYHHHNHQQHHHHHHHHHHNNQQQHHHHLQHHQPPILVGPTLNNNQSSNNNNSANNAQFTFSLNMWNGECHLLGAASATERSLWLEAINACINGEQDDDAATDSASSSDSSPTSNLSAKSTDIGRPSLITMHTGRQLNYTLNTTIGQEIFSCSKMGSRNVANRMKPDVVAAEGRQQQQQALVNNNNNNNSTTMSSISSAAIRHSNDNELQQQQHQDKRKLQQLDARIPAMINSRRISVGNNNSSRQKADMARNGSSQEDKLESRVDGGGGAKLASSCSNGSREQAAGAGTGAGAREREQEIGREEEEGEEDVSDNDDDGDAGDQEGEVSIDDGEDDDEEEEEEEDEEGDDNDNDQDKCDDANQALKRRLISIQADRLMLMDSNEPLKLVTRQLQHQTSSDLYPKKVQQQKQQQQQQQLLINKTTDDQDEDQEMGSSVSSENSSDEEEAEKEVERTPSATVSSCCPQRITPEACDESQQQQQAANLEQKQKQKKRVTFDLSLSSLHQLMSSSSGSSSESNSCTSGSDDSDSSLISSSVSSDDEEDTQPAAQLQFQADKEPENHHPTLDETTGQRGGDEIMASASSPADLEQDCSAGSGQLDTTISRLTPSEVETDSASHKQATELELKLDEAQNNIGLLERKLSGSYASYNQLEASYKRLQLELAKCDELHKCDLARMQLRVDELTRELSASQLKLVETKDKLSKYEEHLANQKQSNVANNQNQPPTNHHHQTRSNTQTRALNWLKLNQQVSGGLAHLHQHQPLLLMHHVKHTLAVNQQTLGLKLLNHSKQIQKKLNELELKVDQIQSTTTATPSLVN